MHDHSKQEPSIRARQDAGTPPFAERVALELLQDRFDFPYVGRDTAPRWAAIIDRHIREATGVR